jgi:hypothetical protein
MVRRPRPSINQKIEVIPETPDIDKPQLFEETKPMSLLQEFLITYGWAILVVLGAIVALWYFGIISPGNLLPKK